MIRRWLEVASSAVRMASRISARGWAKARTEWNLRSLMSSPMRSWREPTMKVSGVSWQFRQFGVDFLVLQRGQRL